MRKGLAIEKSWQNNITLQDLPPFIHTIYLLAAFDIARKTIGQMIK